MLCMLWSWGQRSRPKGCQLTAGMGLQQVLPTSYHQAWQHLYGSPTGISVATSLLSHYQFFGMFSFQMLPPPMYAVLVGCIHVLLREALCVHDDSSDERAWQASHVQQHRAHQCPAAESAGTCQQDGQTVSSLAHHHLQLSSPRQQSTRRCLWSVVQCIAVLSSPSFSMLFDYSCACCYIAVT